MNNKQKKKRIKRLRNKKELGVTETIPLYEIVKKHNFSGGFIKNVESIIPWRIRNSYTLPPPNKDEKEEVYLERIKKDIGYAIKKKNKKIFLKTIGWVVSLASISYAGYELAVKPIKNFIHENRVTKYVQEILKNTRSKINPKKINKVPGWLRITPEWYIPEISYGDKVHDEVIESEQPIVKKLREEKAKIYRDIIPAFSNDKIQNWLRDPNNAFFGNKYEIKEDNYMNTVLAIRLLLSEGGISQFTEGKKKELIDLVSGQKPNEYHDQRSISLMKDAEKGFSFRLEGDKGDFQLTKLQKKNLIKIVDDFFNKYNEKDRQDFLEKGLYHYFEKEGIVLDSDVMSSYLSELKDRLTCNDTLELRLVMLETIFNSKLLGQRNPWPSALYIYHLAGEEGLNSINSIIKDRYLRKDAEAIIGELDENDDSAAEKKNEFIKRIKENKNFINKKINNKDLSASILFESIRFDNMLKKIKGYSNYLQIMPYLGEFGLPVENLEKDEITPWGLWHARRGGGSRNHQGLDINGELGEKILAMQDGIILKVSYQANAGNYIKIRHNGVEITYQHILQIPTRKDYKRLLTKEEVKKYRKDRRTGYELALRRYASIVLNKNVNKLNDSDMDIDNLKKHSKFYQMLERYNKGDRIIVEKGEFIANMGISGNVNQNSKNPEMMTPHVHIGCKSNPMMFVRELKERWPSIKKHHLNDPRYNAWLREKGRWKKWYQIKIYKCRLPDAR